MALPIFLFYVVAHFALLVLGVAWILIENGASPLARALLVDTIWAALNGAEAIPAVEVWFGVFVLSQGWTLYLHQLGMRALYVYMGWSGLDDYPKQRPYGKQLLLSTLGMAFSFGQIVWITWNTSLVILPLFVGGLAAIAMITYRRWGFKQWWSGIPSGILDWRRERWVARRAHDWAWRTC